MKILSLPYYTDHDIYNENMVGFYKNRKIIKLNKPQYIGFATLEFNKLIVFFITITLSLNMVILVSFYYSEIDSLIYHIETKGI